MDIPHRARHRAFRLALVLGIVASLGPWREIAAQTSQLESDSHAPTLAQTDESDESVEVDEATDGTPVSFTVERAIPMSSSFDWSKVPPVVPMARPGSFSIPPSGPGFYSFSDWLTCNYREGPPPLPYIPFGLYPPSYFDSDFRFLEKPDATWSTWADPLKRIHVGDNWLFSTGGGAWYRYMNETNSRFLNTDNEYTLNRTRVYGDMWYQDRFRCFVEYIDAVSNGEELTPLPIDENRSDLLNLFIDAKVAEVNCHSAYVRVGRQELLYGSQRMVSTLDWANTRRTFEGVKAFWHGESWDFDAFWTQPVIPNPHHFDHGDEEQSFSGIWTTYRPRKGVFHDLYFLNRDQQADVAVGSGGVLGDYNISTFGTRYAGDSSHVLWDFEAMYQFGEWSNQTFSAGAATAGVGYHFAHCPWNPQFWALFDWASGDDSPGSGSTRSTFNQNFPFGHYYLGFLDRVGRQNIQDFNLQMVFYPANWITSIVQFHSYRLDSAEDALYNAAGVATRSDPTGAAGRDVGQELDLRFNVHLDTHSELWFGYSKLFAGDFIANTGPDVSPEMTYVMYNFRW